MASIIFPYPLCCLLWLYCIFLFSYLKNNDFNVSSKLSLSFRKLKRDSTPYESDISETDRLLLQKDEEIRRMQDMLTQMQQKLKATAQENKKHDSIIDV